MERRVRSRPAAAAAVVVAVALTLTGRAQAFDHAQAGDVLENALPAAVATLALWRVDREGATQFGLSFGATLLATQWLKHAVHERRPDGSGRDAFPSGHAARAFAAATYMQRRHGWDAARPWYLAAAYVGWTRVNADRHRWRDVAGSLAIAGASSYWLVKPASPEQLVVLPSLAPGHVGVALHARW